MTAVLVPLAGRLAALTAIVEVAGEAIRALGVAEAVPEVAPTPAAFTALKATSYRVSLVRPVILIGLRLAPELAQLAPPSSVYS